MPPAQHSFRLLAILAALAVLLPSPATAVEENEGTICEPVLVDSGVEAYGMLVTFQPGQLMILPDFRLRADPALSETVGFTVWQDRNRDLQYLSHPAGTTPEQPLEFTVGGKAFVLELGRSVLQYRPLAGNELVVWPKADYLARREQANRAAR